MPPSRRRLPEDPKFLLRGQNPLRLPELQRDEGAFRPRRHRCPPRSPAAPASQHLADLWCFALFHYTNCTKHKRSGNTVHSDYVLPPPSAAQRAPSLRDARNGDRRPSPDFITGRQKRPGTKIGQDDCCHPRILVTCAWNVGRCSVRVTRPNDSTGPRVRYNHTS